MSFTESVKNEILNKPIKENCCKRAFLAGLIRGSGVLFSENDSIGVEFRVRDEETAETISRYLKNLYGYEVREFSVSEDRLNKRDNVIIGVSGEERQRELANRVIAEGLSVRTLERLAKQTDSPKKPKPPKETFLVEAELSMTDYIGKPVRIEKTKDRYTMSIDCKSEEELRELLAFMSKS